MSDIKVNEKGELAFEGKTYKCALGKNGVNIDKVEGDGTTPIGYFALRKVLYRADKLAKPETVLPIEEIKEDDGWSDDPNSPEYNTQVKLPYNYSHENLWREDDIYDVVVVLGHNDSPVVPGNGSAVFMHIAREDLTPTDGCVALSKDDILELLSKVTLETKICISN